MTTKLIDTPWGSPQTEKEYADGLILVSTASHGGFFVSDEWLAKMPVDCRDTYTWAGKNWYEEDCDCAIVILAFPEFFSEQEIYFATVSVASSHKQLATPERKARAAAWLSQNGDKWTSGGGMTKDGGWIESAVKLVDPSQRKNKWFPGVVALPSVSCYARKAEIQYPTVLPSRKRNYEATKNDRFVDNMIAIVRAKAKSWFRIHESGDFYSQSYLDKWVEIVKACPEVKFLAFTKSFKLDFAAARKLKNLSLVWSVWPDTDRSTIPKGARAYAGECGPSKESKREAIECPGNCDTCMVCWSLAKRGFDVHFSIH